jgi:Rps23 Pro-64 3,4-dihydroxylase Tpa1-like proline 4-hydroxylase
MLYNNPTIYDDEALYHRAKKLHKLYKNNKPFEHIILDELFRYEVLNEVYEHMKETDKIFNNTQGVLAKYENDVNYIKNSVSIKFDSDLPDSVKHFFNFLNGSVFIKFLSILSGISNLEKDVDPFGSDISYVPNGGYLNIHTDFNQYNIGKSNMWRRINVLLYMNKDWKIENGGSLEFWNDDATRCVHKIVPVFNRIVIFNTSNISLYGYLDIVNHPEKLDCMAFSTCYYSKEKHPNIEGYHPDLYLSNTMGTQSAERYKTIMSDNYYLECDTKHLVSSPVSDKTIQKTFAYFTRC